MKLHQNIYQIMALKLKEGTGIGCFYPALLGGKMLLPGYGFQPAATSFWTATTLTSAVLRSNLVYEGLL